jgi:hypothetical protein
MIVAAIDAVYNPPPTAQQDRPSAQKADAGYDLRGDPRRVEHDVLVAEHIREAERRHDHDERRADTHEHMCAQPRRPRKALPLEADHAAECCREHEPGNEFEIADHVVLLVMSPVVFALALARAVDLRRLRPDARYVPFALCCSIGAYASYSFFDFPHHECNCIDA